MSTATHQKPGPRLLAHIAGPSGSGKTRLGRALQRRLPHVTVKDLDEFTWQFNPGNRDPGGVGKRRATQHYQHWLTTQHKPLILVGFEQSTISRPGYRRSADFPLPPGGRRYLLNTGPLRSIWRHWKRNWKNSLPLEGPRRLWQRYQVAHQDRHMYQRLGYQLASRHQILHALTQAAAQKRSPRGTR